MTGSTEKVSLRALLHHLDNNPLCWKLFLPVLVHRPENGTRLGRTDVGFPSDIRSWAESCLRLRFRFRWKKTSSYQINQKKVVSCRPLHPADQLSVVFETKEIRHEAQRDLPTKTSPGGSVWTKKDGRTGQTIFRWAPVCLASCLGVLSRPLEDPQRTTGDGRHR